MKLKMVVVDFELSQAAKRRARVAFGTIGLVLAASAAASADTPVPTFIDNEFLTTANMNQLVTSINAIQSHPTVTRGGKQYSVAATYCGNAASTNGQITNAYAGAKALCEAAAGCTASAHMCTSEEAVRSAALGIKPPQEGWISAGISVNSYEFTGGTTVPHVELDCLNWTSPGDGTEAAMTWGPLSFNSRKCEGPYPILCCD